MDRQKTAHPAIDYVGTRTIAKWFGVQSGTVSKWMKRYPNFPTPDSVIGDQTYGWLPEREQEIRDWEEARWAR